MRKQSTPSKGDLTLDDALDLTGVVAGSVTVRDGGRLGLKGVVSGDLRVEKGGQATVQGSVGGEVLNRGGELTVLGAVRGRLHTESGRTRIHEDAEIAGGVTGPFETISR